MMIVTTWSINSTVPVPKNTDIFVNGRKTYLYFRVCFEYCVKHTDFISIFISFGMIKLHQIFWFVVYDVDVYMHLMMYDVSSPQDYTDVLALTFDNQRTIFYTIHSILSLWNILWAWPFFLELMTLALIINLKSANVPNKWNKSIIIMYEWSSRHLLHKYWLPVDVHN